MKKGDELNEFYFIGKTRRGCPVIKHRKLGDNGIQIIEVSNVGRSFEKDGHIKRIRITSLKEDGKTEYQMYFKDVFIRPSQELYKKYDEKCAKFLKEKQKQLKNIMKSIDKYADIIMKSVF